MALERMSNVEIENVLRVSAKSDLSPQARVLINELYQRVALLEQQVADLRTESGDDGGWKVEKVPTEDSGGEASAVADRLAKIETLLQKPRDYYTRMQRPIKSDFEESDTPVLEAIELLVEEIRELRERV